ncbi:hypothetical protein L1987_79925 [Smallanthus sonchifolius]|uniref:Uncharacterized protein n=1 Tax=Smallanthus sonchifolius TaxID=185202 RepID=A0ACB8YLX5_9ASTR|nr:hypothetical protein L1987_79925 [Smallanthus sonchifolius]
MGSEIQLVKLHPTNEITNSNTPLNTAAFKEEAFTTNYGVLSNLKARINDLLLNEADARGGSGGSSHQRITPQQGRSSWPRVTYFSMAQPPTAEVVEGSEGGSGAPIAPSTIGQTKINRRSLMIFFVMLSLQFVRGI